MIMYEQDSEIHRWGFDFLNCDLFSVSPYCGVNTQQDSDFYDNGYVGHANIGTECIIVENDEIIAHALQEELSQLAVAEASGSTHEEKCLQVSVLAQDWFGPCTGSYLSGNESNHDEGDDTEASSSCSSAGKNSYEEVQGTLELTDDYLEIDGEVGKRLNQMVSIPHVPRINGEIPSVDEAISDHQRLIDRLLMYDLVELKVQGDGNCQYGVKIFVITSFKDTCYIEILPGTQKSKRVIFLSFWAEVHYNSIYPEGDLPASDLKKKKKWWQFRNKH
ncbi:OVARIAN TUMOR DOMAIN-containing deubiquitinating enzyme 9-like isoform X3 [Zingiber officinale]|uniref:OVARIAN TUMOR DOMAIN-containing deubiquitinating enzyme 9-like isoform X3 n=1 Tax=Zingiber officinale TaxID=94328 RepID=UPI001C4A7921|nr:OVARIAN TUMOR DOMAIN-containing deubiquitinating enzyme 9-like isoform X3 [Zingiber officinale]